MSNKEDKKQRKREKKEKHEKRKNDNGERKLQDVVGEDEIADQNEDIATDVVDPEPNKKNGEEGTAVSPTIEQDDDSVDDDGAGTKKRRKRKRKRKTTTDDDDDEGNSKNNNVVGVDTPVPDIHKNAVEHTVYVEGIPFDVTVDRVREFFEANGINDVLQLRLPTWQDSGRLRGYGHVRLGSSESYDKALKLSGAYLNRRYLTIQAANVPGGIEASGQTSFSFTEPADNKEAPKDCRTLFLTNLPYDATEDDISNVFCKYGKIAEDGVRIARNSVNRQSKGFAYIDFATPKDAQKVVEVATKRAMNVGGRMVRLDYDTGRIKGSFRTDSGRLWTKETKEKKR